MWAGTVVITGLIALIILKKPLSMPRLSARPASHSGAASGSGFDLFKQLSSVAVVIAALIIVPLRWSAVPVSQSIAILVVAVVFAAMNFPTKVIRISVGIPSLAGISLSRRDLGWGVFWAMLFVALRLSSSHIKPEGGGGKLEFVHSPIPVTTTAELFVHWGWQLSLVALASLLLHRWSLRTLMMWVFLALQYRVLV